jgi:hypothetical protein
MPGNNGRRSTPLPPAWDAIRAAVLARDPFCRWGSLPSDMATPGLCAERSVEADHTGAPDDHSLTSLRGLCRRHHATRTGRQGAEARAAVMPTRRRPTERHPGYKPA